MAGHQVVRTSRDPEVLAETVLKSTTNCRSERAVTSACAYRSPGNRCRARQRHAIHTEQGVNEWVRASGAEAHAWSEYKGVVLLGSRNTGQHATAGGANAVCVRESRHVAFDPEPVVQECGRAGIPAVCVKPAGAAQADVLVHASVGVAACKL